MIIRMADLANKYLDSTGLKTLLNRIAEMYNSLKNSISSSGGSVSVEESSSSMYPVGVLTDDTSSLGYDSDIIIKGTGISGDTLQIEATSDEAQDPTLSISGNVIDISGYIEKSSMSTDETKSVSIYGAIANVMNTQNSNYGTYIGGDVSGATAVNQMMGKPVYGLALVGTNGESNDANASGNAMLISASGYNTGIVLEASGSAGMDATVEGTGYGMKLTATGEDGIKITATGDDGYGFYVSGTGTTYGVYMEGDGDTNDIYLSGDTYIDGDIECTGTLSEASDSRMKTDIADFDALSIVDQLTPVTFKWNDKAKEISDKYDTESVNYGLIAQDSDGVMDGLVSKSDDESKMWSVSYVKLIPVLLKAIKELKAENAAIRETLDGLSSK